MEFQSKLHGIFQDSKQLYFVLDALNKQRQYSKLCDVILKVSEEQIFAHSNVLAAASPYFDNLFNEQDMPRAFSSRTPQIIEIHIDGPNDPGYKIAVQRVVEFMYTSRIELENNVISQIIEIAHIMRMNGIIECCELFQQGNSSFITDVDPLLRYNHLREAETQTDNGIIIDDRKKAVVFNKLENRNYKCEEKLAFKRHLKCNKMLNGVDLKKKHSRAHKVNLVKGGNEKSIVQELDSANGIAKLQETGNIKENNDAPRNEICEINSSVLVQNDNNKSMKPLVKIGDYIDSVDAHVNIDAKLRVSRKGRIIKPKKFPDDMVAFVKQEFVTDDDGYCDAKQNDKEIIEAADEITAPSYIKEELDGHLVANPAYICDLCGYHIKSLKAYSEHNMEHLRAQKKCSYCGWICDDPSITIQEFEEHVNNHTGPEPFFCSFCSLRFKTRMTLLQHLPKHSKSKPYICHICSAGFKWKHALTNHMIVHNSTKDYLCDICGFATAHKAQLKAHHLIHTGETFKCPEVGCQYQSTKKTNLKFHMMTHSQEKPHQCEVCGTSFSLEKNMKRHKLLHTSDRPYKCDTCSFSTTRFDKLKEHYFKQHNIGKKPGKKFRLTDYLKMQECVDKELDADKVTLDERVLDIGEIGEDFETIELHVEGNERIASTRQIVNVSGTIGETFPITIIENGKEVVFEIQQMEVVEQGNCV